MNERHMYEQVIITCLLSHKYLNTQFIKKLKKNLVPTDIFSLFLWWFLLDLNCFKYFPFDLTQKCGSYQVLGPTLCFLSVTVFVHFFFWQDDWPFILSTNSECFMVHFNYIEEKKKYFAQRGLHKKYGQNDFNDCALWFYA